MITKRITFLRDEIYDVSNCIRALFVDTVWCADFMVLYNLPLLRVWRTGNEIGTKEMEFVVGLGSWCCINEGNYNSKDTEKVGRILNEK
jgi:hypothetical protein